MYFRIMDMWELGLIDHWVNEACFVPNAEKCLANPQQQRSTKVEAIKLTDLKGAFYILAIGIGCAILVFILEHIVVKYQKEMQLTKVTSIDVEENKSNATPLVLLKEPIAVKDKQEKESSLIEEKTLEVMSVISTANEVTSNSPIGTISPSMIQQNGTIQVAKLTVEAILNTTTSTEVVEPTSPVEIAKPCGNQLLGMKENLEEELEVIVLDDKKARTASTTASKSSPKKKTIIASPILQTQSLVQ